MSRVAFDVAVPMRAPADRVWLALVDWSAHGDWIPATRSRILRGDGGIGTEFEAVSGFRPVALVDRMRVTQLDAAELTASVEKLGPVLRGQAGYTVRSDAPHSVVHWHEDVQVPLLPQVLSPTVAAVSAMLFRLALRRLDARID